MRLKILMISLVILFSSLSAIPECILITMLYNEKKSDRIQEYMTCLENNLANPYIKHIHVLYDMTHDDDQNILLNYLESKHITIVRVRGRKSYNAIFSTANRYYPNATIIISNADIYFNETLRYVEAVDLTNTFLVLTRWNVLANNTLQLQGLAYGSPNEYSHDTWVLKTPFKGVKDGDILMGVPGCDAAIAHRAIQSGYRVINPCLTIQACHLHASDKRYYDHQGYTWKNGYAKTPWIALPGVPSVK